MIERNRRDSREAIDVSEKRFQVNLGHMEITVAKHPLVQSSKYKFLEVSYDLIIEHKSQLVADFRIIHQIWDVVEMFQNLIVSVHNR